MVLNLYRCYVCTHAWSSHGQPGEAEDCPNCGRAHIQALPHEEIIDLENPQLDELRSVEGVHAHDEHPEAPEESE